MLVDDFLKLDEDAFDEGVNISYGKFEFVYCNRFLSTVNKTRTFVFNAASVSNLS